jgi:hypothetical protein
MIKAELIEIQGRISGGTYIAVFVTGPKTENHVGGQIWQPPEYVYASKEEQKTAAEMIVEAINRGSK